jgi:hypothetical protein
MLAASRIEVRVSMPAFVDQDIQSIEGLHGGVAHPLEISRFADVGLHPDGMAGGCFNRVDHPRGLVGMGDIVDDD